MRSGEYQRPPPQDLLKRQLDPEEVKFAPEDQTELAALLAPLHRCPTRFCTVCACRYGRTRSCGGTAD
jgi:hypothetical protein